MKRTGSGTLQRIILSAMVLACAACSIAQDDDIRPDNRSLAYSLADTAKADAESLRISLPPAAEPLLGAIVVPGKDGLKAIDRMPPGSFEASKEWEGGSDAQSDSFIANPQSFLIRRFLVGIEDLNEGYRTSFDATNVVRSRLTPASVVKAKEFIFKSKPAIEAAQKEEKLFLVTAAYTGQVELKFELQDTVAAAASPLGDRFTLSRPRPGTGVLDLSSKGPVEFAYHLDAIDFSLTSDGKPEKVSLRPSNRKDVFHASAWENTELVYGAGPEQFHRVKVFYATDRNLAPPTSAEKKKTWWLFFVSYFLSPWPYVLLVVALVLLYALWWGLSRPGWLPKWLPHAAIILISVALPAVFAAIYAWQQTERPGAVVKEPVSAHRGELTYGTCEVSVPKNHKIGELPRPFSLFLIDLETENPNRTISVLARNQSTDIEFFEQLRERLKESPQGECFVFVHGYNNTFDNAAQRTAQLWIDLQFQGAPIFFSWPSRGATAGYSFDETEAGWAQTDFVAFLNRLRADPSVKRIHLIAHSMGNRIVSGALADMASDGILKAPDCKFREVVLAAADIDADTFKRSIAPRFTNQSPHVTFYGSSNDGALKYSYTFHDYRRAGDATGGVLTLPGMDSIDASLLDTSFDNHGYFAAQRSVVSDIELLLTNGLPPVKRGLREEGMGDARHWVFRP